MVREASAWTKFLTNFHNKNNKGKSLGLSMKPAAKLWKTVKNKVSRGGDSPAVETETPGDDETVSNNIKVDKHAEAAADAAQQAKDDAVAERIANEKPSIVDTFKAENELKGGKRRRGKKTAKKSSRRRKRKTCKK
jgi:hypothetical protein